MGNISVPIDISKLHLDFTNPQTALYLLVVLVVVLFVVGISLIFKGFINSPDEASIVPKKVLEEAKKELAQSKLGTEELKLRLDSLGLELGDTQKQIVNYQKQEEEFGKLKANDFQHQVELEALGKNLKFLQSKADSLAQGAYDVIQQLKTENGLLQQKVFEAKDKVQKEEYEKVSQERNNLQSEAEKHLQKIAELQSHLLSIENQSQKDHNTLDSLKGENQILVKGVEQIARKIKAVEEFYRQFKDQTDTRVLEEQKKVQEKIHSLLSELEELQKQSQEKLKVADENIAQLREKVKGLNSESDEKFKRLQDDLLLSQAEARRAYMMVEQLRTQGGFSAFGVGQPLPSATGMDSFEKTAMVKQKVEFENKVRGLEDINVRLKEKERILTFELTKSRAQIMALEKMCQELKNLQKV